MSSYTKIYRKIHWGKGYAPFAFDFMHRAIADKAYNNVKFDVQVGTDRIRLSASMEVNYQLDERKRETNIKTRRH